VTAGRPTPSQQLEIRPIKPSDKATLVAAVEQSSGDATYRRFLNPHAGIQTSSPTEELSSDDFDRVLGGCQPARRVPVRARRFTTTGPRRSTRPHRDVEGSCTGTAEGRAHR
jgi:hypothetical protein